MLVKLENRIIPQGLIYGVKIPHMPESVMPFLRGKQNIRQVEITAYNLTSWLKQLVPISNAVLIIDINIHYNAQVLSIYSYGIVSQSG